MMRGSFFSSSATSGSRRVGGKLRLIIGAVIFNISTYGRCPSTMVRRSSIGKNLDSSSAEKEGESSTTEPANPPASTISSATLGPEAVTDNGIAAEFGRERRGLPTVTLDAHALWTRRSRVAGQRRRDEPNRWL